MKRLPDAAFIAGVKAIISYRVVRVLINMWIVSALRTGADLLKTAIQCDQGRVVHENPTTTIGRGIDFFTDFLPSAIAGPKPYGMGSKQIDSHSACRCIDSLAGKPVIVVCHFGLQSCAFGRSFVTIRNFKGQLSHKTPLLLSVSVL